MQLRKKLMLCTLLAIGAGTPVWAADFFDGSLYYNKLSDSTVEVTYPTGALTGTNDAYNKPTSFGSTYEGNIVIPETVEDNKITYTVVRIGDDAFHGAWVEGKAKDLLSVEIPETVTEIGANAFANRRTMTKVNIPSGLVKLGESAFMNCSSLGNMYFIIPGTVKKLEPGTFQGCSKLDYVKLEEGIEEIGRECFQSCSWLEHSEKNVKFTTVPSTVKKIGANAFSYCNYLYDFVIPESVTWNEAMWWCGFDSSTRLKSISMPNGITSVGNYCFRNTKLTEFTLRSGVTKLSEDAFVDCALLTKFVVEPSDVPLTFSFSGVFNNTKKLTSLHLGREMSPFLFSNQDELTDVTIITDKVLETPTFPDAVYENATLTVPEGMVETYRAHAQWGKFKNITDGTVNNSWIEDVTFNCVAEDGVIYVSPRRIAGLFPQFTPADAATWSNVTYSLTDAGTSRDELIASLYTVNYFMPGRVKFPELQGYRPGECKLTVTVKNPNDATAEPFVREFTVKVVEVDRTERPQGYVDGTIILNEEWFTHTNGSLNYITEDDEIIYQAYERENPGMSFGATSQYGTIWADKLIVASKQAADGGDPLPGGGRLVIADAKTLKRLGSLDVLEWDGVSGDGRAVAGATPDKIYVGTSNGIYIVDITDPTAPVVTGKIAATESGNAADLYNGQIGDMVTTAGHVFAIKQSFGTIIIDVNTDEVVKTIDDANIQGVTQTMDGTVWLATIDSNNCSNFVPVDSRTLEVGTPVVIPAEIGRVLCGWGAWRSTAFKGSVYDNEIWFVTGAASIMGGATGDYYRYKIGDDPADLTPFFTLNGLTGETEFGETVAQMTYGTPCFDARNNRLVVMTGRKGASSGGYRDHWIHYVDGSTGAVTKTFHLEPYYWFQSLPIFPDKHDVAFHESFNGLEIEHNNGDVEIDLYDIVHDKDNIPANIRFSAVDEAMPMNLEDETADNGKVAEFALDGSKLTISPAREGATNFLFTAESNGRPVTLSLSVVVKSATGIDNVEAAAGTVRVAGNRIYVDGFDGDLFALYNTAGHCVAAFTADSDNYVAEFNLTPGVYILRGDKVSVKLAVK
ncbi:MAG: leucine-rich repeat protein [Pseudoflavonifractor sp.]|nr:leucine-rich repeat protein [Pseudoflavonifractor sp.]